MKKTPVKAKPRRPKPAQHDSDDLQPEYRFDYSQAKPNRFADRFPAGAQLIPIDPDVAKVFTSPESVNSVLRALIATMPK